MKAVPYRRRIRLDRIQSIFKMHEQGRKNREIAKICRCSASTVSNTLNKYKHPDELIWEGMSCYERAKYVWDMQKAALRCRKRFKGHIRSEKKRKYVVEKLITEEWSPEIIANKIFEDIGENISTNTIYRFIKKSRRDLIKYLWEKGKPRKQRVMHRRGSFKQKQHEKKKYIDQRSEAVNSREEFGHWEGDLVLGPKKGSGKVLLTLIERKTRYKRVIRMPNREAETTLAYIRPFLMSLPPEARKSVTLDNGGEFSEFAMHKLEKIFPGFKVYYTSTYAPQEKGSNEHGNGRLRRPFPKKTDFASVPWKKLELEVDKLNRRPMKLHGFKTPLQMFQKELELLYLKLAA